MIAIAKGQNRGESLDVCKGQTHPSRGTLWIWKQDKKNRVSLCPGTPWLLPLSCRSHMVSQLLACSPYRCQAPKMQIFLKSKPQLSARLCPKKVFPGRSAVAYPMWFNHIKKDFHMGDACVTVAHRMRQFNGFV